MDSASSQVPFALKRATRLVWVGINWFPNKRWYPCSWCRRSGVGELMVYIIPNLSRHLATTSLYLAIILPTTGSNQSTLPGKQICFLNPWLGSYYSLYILVVHNNNPITCLHCAGNNAVAFYNGGDYKMSYRIIRFISSHN